MDRYSGENEFSIIRGGLLDRILSLGGIAKSNNPSVLRKISFYTLVTWFPLVVLSGLQGFLWTSSIDIPFLMEFATNIRLLLAIPLFVISEIVIDHRIKLSLGQFYRSGLLTEESMGKFEKAKQTADRMCESYWAEAVILVFILANLSLRYSVNSFELSTWIFPFSEASNQLSWAGYWAAFISFPIFQFLLLRWIWRWVIWVRLMRMVSKVGLRLIPTHPDKAGGLGFLGESPMPFSTFSFTLSVIFSAMLSQRIIHQGFNLEEHYALIFAFILLCILINVVPLLTFVSELSKARVKGIQDFHRLVALHHLQFSEKWFNPGNPPEDLLESPDPSSMADIQAVYESVKNMTIFPFNFKTMLTTLAISIFPLIFAFSFQIPIGDLLKKIFGLLV